MTTDLERYLKAIAVMFEPLESLCAEEGTEGEAGYVSAWSKLLNVETAPEKALPYLAQYVGVEIPKGSDEAEARAIIKRAAGLKRGTPQSLAEAIESVLGVGEPYAILERTNPKTAETEGYWFTVLVRTGKATKALYEAINQVIGGGLLYEILTVKNAFIEGTKKWNEVATGVKFSAIKEGEY